MRADRRRVAGDLLAARVGMRLILVAAIVGLLVLAWSGIALASPEPAALGQALVAVEPRTPEQRAEEARNILTEQRNGRVQRLTSALVHTGFRAATTTSPRKLLKAFRRVGREVWSWRLRTAEDDRALALLEADRARDLLPDHARSLWQSLDEDARAARRAELRREFDAALETGATRSARWWLRALERVDDAAAADARERLTALAPVPDVLASPLTRPLAGDGVAFAAALLAGHDLQAAADDPEQRLAVAVADLLEGRRSSGLEELRRLAGRRGAVAERARLWLDDPQIHPEGRVEQAWTDYRRRRWLGRIGGDELARDGFSLEVDAVRAWRDSLSPMNLAFELPLRWWSDWKPEPDPLLEATHAYLRAHPDGAHADEFRARVAGLSPRRARPHLFRNGQVELPPAFTPFERLATQHLLVSVEALAAAFDEEQRAALGFSLDGIDAVLVSSEAPDAGELRFALPRAVHTLARLATGLEERSLRTSRDVDAEALERLRQLELRARDGYHVTAEPWLAGGGEDGLGLSFARGEEVRTQQRIRLSRGRKDLRAERLFGSDDLPCPEARVCVERRPRVEGSVYARVDLDGELRVGASTRAADARLGMEVSEGGPGAGVDLPVAQWLGVSRWLPVRARFHISAEGVDFAPDVDR